MAKNPCGKTMPLDDPYEIWCNKSWEWRVLKKYQAPEKEAENSFARWFCAVKSPYTFGEWEHGDVYVKDVVTYATRVYKKGDNNEAVSSNKHQADA